MTLCWRVLRQQLSLQQQRDLAVIGAAQIYFVVSIAQPRRVWPGVCHRHGICVGRQSFAPFRMSEVVVKYVGEALAQDEQERAAALVKGIGLAEAVTLSLPILFWPVCGVRREDLWNLCFPVSVLWIVPARQSAL